MKKYLIGAAALLLIGMGGWYFASPYMALNGLQDAVQQGDADGLEQHVDFPAVRESLKSELKAKLAEEMAKEQASDNPFAALGLAFADKVADKMLDGLLTPRGLATLIKQQKAKEGSGEGGSPGDLDHLEIERSGFSKFTLINTQDENSPILIFKRDGLGWKLTDIDMSRVEFPGTGN